ncbi:MAG: hypothetical protein QX190_15355 [Methylococcales bacterium]
MFHSNKIIQLTFSPHLKQCSPTSKKIDTLTPSDFEIFVRDVFVAAGWADALITKVGQESC